MRQPSTCRDADRYHHFTFQISNLKFARSLPARTISPRLRRTAGVDALHRDRTRGRTHKSAKIAADAFFFENVGVPLSVDFLKSKTLVCTVFARDVAEIAADAVLVVDVSFDVVVEIEISPIGHAIDRFPDDVIH